MNIIINSIELDKNPLIIKLPDDATDPWVNSVGCIRYTHNGGRESACIEPFQLGFYATLNNCKFELSND